MARVWSFLHTMGAPHMDNAAEANLRRGGETTWTHTERWFETTDKSSWQDLGEIIAQQWDRKWKKKNMWRPF